ncbi:LADA_0A09054g1_1 [Lachancea dasiensis]|uniref:LADA_0A09054g1_1 n=1 Tax=Lachancea dasiensis TaxID=1072105 RepID=A0A1G4IQM0_9SACH|nr:LADA_0A09054g1_1 [Lachancea dasiensis]
MFRVSAYNTVTERYALASQARTKLLRCASQSKKSDLDLRVLVGHANLLDKVMETLQEEDGSGESDDECEIEPVQLTHDLSNDDRSYVVGEQHVTFSLPSVPVQTVHEYNSDSDSDSEDDDDEPLSSNDDDDDYSLSDPEEELKMLGRNTQLRRPGHYTLASDGGMMKISNGNLLLVSIPEEDEEHTLDISSPRQMSHGTAV